MAREKRKPKQPKTASEKQTSSAPADGTDGNADGKEGDTRKEFLILFDSVPDPEMSEAAKEELKELMERLRRGEKLSLPHSRPMPSIGRRCHELRVTEADGIWRVFYRVDSDRLVAVRVLWKTTQATPDDEIKLCKTRLAFYDAKRPEFSRPSSE